MDGSSSRSPVVQEHAYEEEEQSSLIGPDGYDASSKSAGHLVPPMPDSHEEIEIKSQSPPKLLKSIHPWQFSATVHPVDRRPNWYLRPENTTNITVTSKAREFWAENRSCMLVVTSSLFSSAMALFTKLLELGDDGMDAFQILFIRMGVTTIWCTSLLCLKGNPDSLIGPKEVRGLLLFRGISGFFGILGIWTAIKFLSLADASVVTFLTPTIVGIYSAIYLRQPYTRKEQLASLVALAGVVFIARPSFLFGSPSRSGPSSPATGLTRHRRDRRQAQNFTRFCGGRGQCSPPLDGNIVRTTERVWWCVGHSSPSEPLVTGARCLRRPTPLLCAAP